MQTAPREFQYIGKPGKWVYFRDLLPGDRLMVDEDGRPAGIRTIKEVGKGMQRGAVMVSYAEGGWTSEAGNTAVQLEA